MSTLRDAQSQAVREKLLQAAVDVLADQGTGELTMRAIAAQAKVSVPTAYRYFSNLQLLLDAMHEHVIAKLGIADYPNDLDGAIGFARTLYPSFERQGPLVRAYLESPRGSAVRTRHHELRSDKMGEAMDRELIELEPGARRGLAALFQALLSANTWGTLHEQWGLSGDQAGEMVEWALRALRDSAKKQPGKVPKIATRRPRKGEE